MKIAVDAFPLTQSIASGIPNYTRRVLQGVIALDERHEYLLYCKDRFEYPENDTVRLRVGETQSGGGASYGNTLWLFSAGVRMMKRDGVDLFWGTRQMLPPYCGRMRKVLTVYDMVWHYFPETMDWYNRAVLKILAKRSISLADHIVTISKATAQSLNEVLGVPLNRITVAYPAADDYTVFDKRASGAYIAENYGVSRNYILTVSTVEPRKNLVALLRSFSPIRREGFQLVIAGAMGWKNSPLSEEIARLGFSDDEVRFLGFVPDADMNKLYCGAQLFVFPSLYEGFGIPPLEAMASGTPVIASWSSSLPEVVGEAGTLLDPNDIDCWTEAVLQTMRDESLRGRMAADGVNQARNFSWHATARNVMDAFHAGASC